MRSFTSFRMTGEGDEEKLQGLCVALVQIITENSCGMVEKVVRI